MNLINRVTKGVILGFVLILIVSLLYFAYHFKLHELNQPLNKLVKGQPNKQCVVDSDCQMRITNCDNGCFAQAVNRKWEAFCPFRSPVLSCSLASGVSKIIAECQNNLCTEKIIYLKPPSNSNPENPEVFPSSEPQQSAQ